MDLVHHADSNEDFSVACLHKQLSLQDHQETRKKDRNSRRVGPPVVGGRLREYAARLQQLAPQPLRLPIKQT